jgi:hypothetical protein
MSSVHAGVRTVWGAAIFASWSEPLKAPIAVALTGRFVWSRVRFERLYAVRVSLLAGAEFEVRRGVYAALPWR